MQKLNSTIEREKRKFFEPHTTKLMTNFLKLQSGIGERKTGLLAACCIIWSFKLVGHHFWPSLIPLHKGRLTSTPGPNRD
jgi:hypothetical protein